MAVDGSSYLMVRKNKFALEIDQILKKIVEYHSLHNVPLRRHLENSHGNRIKFGVEIKQLKPIHCSLFTTTSHIIKLCYSKERLLCN